MDAKIGAYGALPSAELPTTTTRQPPRRERLACLRPAHVAAGLVAIAMLPAGAVIAPASAQVGGIVHDPRNYAQNILTAARTLEQINNQIKQLQNQATSLVNEARNLQSLPVSTLQELQGQVDRTRELLGEAQRVAFDVAV